MLGLLLLAAALAAEDDGKQTLLDSFRAFAECEGESARHLLSQRLSFFERTPTEAKKRQQLQTLQWVKG